MERSDKKCAHCSTPCEMKCSKCSKVGYCRVEHQKLDWKTHKKHCFPAIELENDTYGHYLKSTRKILAGELIFAEGPLVLAPFATNKDRLAVCLGCCKVLPGIFGDGLYSCQKCSWPLCRQDCDQISYHSKNECKIFQTQKVTPQVIIFLPPSPPVDAIYDCIKVIRILLLKESDPEEFAKFLQLESNDEHRARTDVGALETKFTLKVIHGCCKMSRTLYPVELINKILGVVLTNSIEETGTTNARVRLRESHIFEKGSKLNHSCIPNTKNAMKSKTRIRRVFAATEIEKDEMLTECYASKQIYWNGIVERRQNFYENYHFWCSCPRCSDPTELGTYFSAIKCKKASCSGFYLPLNPLSTDGHDSIWKCTSGDCKMTQKYSKLSNTVSAIEDEIQKSMTVDEKLSIIQIHSNVSVHENHFTLMKLKYDLLPDLLNRSFTKAIEFAEKCVEMADKLAPGLSTHRGMVLFYLAQAKHKSITKRGLDIQAQMKALAETTPIREEAKRILGVMPEGSQGHGFYQTLLRQEDKFKESIVTLENVLKLNEMGID